MRRLAIFTGSSGGNAPWFLELAAEVGQVLGQKGIGVVYGGGRRGLMGALAQGAWDAGGEVIGVIPRSMVEREWARHELTELHICDTMHERKALMSQKADAFLALPGGLGTLEEIFEVWTWRQLGFHGKPVGFLNRNEFWTPLLGAMHGIVAAGFLSAAAMEDVVVGEDLPDVLDALSQRLPETVRPRNQPRCCDGLPTTR
jgi:uncharacterized protein (TIGR00730 family)